ncbi:GNAT family N-acetyltransferase [Cyclobacterium salsum]|uniref:GNAT family N-acetyltransferase n=1 Tax=Cyclobacterium salsum TaxID=2666329 RepID=UPI001391B5A6|nr:GNAT family N-acetyltransferase [Cyclobacterium salsum]
MKLNIKIIGTRDIYLASELLTRNFVSDRGVMMLFKENDANYTEKVNHWFKATLKMLIDNKQIIKGAFWGDELVGVSIVTHASYKPSILSLLKWSYSVFMTCGIKTVRQSAKHDLSRRKTFTDKNQLILEFIAVNQEHRGKGIGKKLFESLDALASSKNASVWLETTKDYNIEIFNKMGYRLIDTRNESTVRYHIMTNEK